MKYYGLDFNRLGNSHLLNTNFERINLSQAIDEVLHVAPSRIIVFNRNDVKLSRRMYQYYTPDALGHVLSQSLDPRLQTALFVGFLPLG